MEAERKLKPGWNIIGESGLHEWSCTIILRLSTKVLHLFQTIHNPQEVGDIRAFEWNKKINHETCRMRFSMRCTNTARRALTRRLTAKIANTRVRSTNYPLHVPLERLLAFNQPCSSRRSHFDLMRGCLTQKGHNTFLRRWHFCVAATSAVGFCFHKLSEAKKWSLCSSA